MAAIPETMEKLNVAETEQSLIRIEEYLKYLQERINFAHGNLDMRLQEVEDRI